MISSPASVRTRSTRLGTTPRSVAEISVGVGDQRKVRRPSNAEINRELAALKRILSLAVEGGKLLHERSDAQEDNVRTGFFEADQCQSVRSHLPEALRPVVTFAYLTGWRIPSEVLTLQLRQVSFTERLSRNNQRSEQCGSI